MQETMEATQAMIDHLAAVNKILEKYNYSEARLIPILQEVQAVYKYLSKDMISYVATSIGVPCESISVANKDRFSFSRRKMTSRRTASPSSPQFQLRL